MKFKTTPKGVAYLVNTQEDIKQYNTDIFTISRGMVNIMAGIKGIDIWANFTEEENKKSKQDKSKKNKAEAKSVAKRIKETASELKKVSWPSFGKVAKSTLVVIVVVLFFTIALFGIDYVLNLLFNLLTPSA